MTRRSTRCGARSAEERFGADWRQGREMPLDDAIAYALEEEGARIQR